MKLQEYRMIITMKSVNANANANFSIIKFQIKHAKKNTILNILFICLHV